MPGGGSCSLEKPEVATQRKNALKWVWKDRVFARGRNGTGQRWSNLTNSHERPCCVVGRHPRTAGKGDWGQGQSGKLSSHSASRISTVCQGHSVIKLVVNGLKAARRGVRRKPCPEPWGSRNSPDLWLPVPSALVCFLRNSFSVCKSRISTSTSGDAGKMRHKPRCSVPAETVLQKFCYGQRLGEGAGGHRPLGKLENYHSV